MSLSKPLRSDRPFFARLYNPFEELALDAALALRDFSSACEAVFCEGNAALEGMGQPSRPSAEEGPSGEMLGSGSEPGLWGTLAEVSQQGYMRLKAPLAELSEDAGPAGTVALLAAASPLMAAAPPSAAVVLCGLTVHTKGLYAMLGFCMAIGAHSVWTRYPEEEADRSVQQRSAAALACSGCLHLLLAAGYGIPPSIATSIAHPDVFVRFLPDLVSVPLIILNVGYLAGRKTQDMAPTAAFGFLGAVSFAAAAAVPGPQALPLLGSGIALMAKAAYDVRSLPMKAGAISAVNKLRTQITTDLLVFSWIGIPLVEGLGLVDCISLNSELSAFVILDLLGKNGVCHIVLRSQEAFLNAQSAMAADRRSLPPVPVPAPAAGGG